MIIPIMGNHGSGKSHLVGQVVDIYESVNLVTDGRKLTRQPVIMECSSADAIGLCVIGYYQLGRYSGIDSGRFAGRMDEIFSWVHEYHSGGWHVIFEGMLVAGMSKRVMSLPSIAPVYIDLSVEECAVSVLHRKATSTRGHKHAHTEVNLGVINSKKRTCDKVFEAFASLGTAFKGNRSECLKRVTDILGVAP